MSHMSAVRPFQAGDAPAATAIVRGLPGYFTEDVPGKVEHDVDTIDPLPGWEPGNPAAIYVAALRPTRDVTS